jgi:hypothetical protein
MVQAMANIADKKVRSISHLEPSLAQYTKEPFYYPLIRLYLVDKSLWVYNLPDQKDFFKVEV